MPAKLIFGKDISKDIYVELRKRLEVLVSMGIIPGLAVILVGDDPTSQTYVRKNSDVCKNFGIRLIILHMPLDITQDQIISQINELNNDQSVHGILIQLPLPSHLDKNKIMSQLSPLKDIDCSHPMNVGRMLIGNPYLLPATPAGIQQMLIRSGINTRGKHVVIIGRSNIVGKPMAAIMIQKGIGADSTVTLVNSYTIDLSHITRQADILIVAVGRPHFITSKMVKDGAVVIDVGINYINCPDDSKHNKLVGDVDFESVINKSSAITPVPGGVGPMTICMIISNTIKAAETISNIG